MRYLLSLLLLVGGCAAPRTVDLPPMPPGLAESVAPPAPSAMLIWEHNQKHTPGFTVERTEDFQTWQQIGFVAVTNIHANNGTNFTYTFPLAAEPPDKAFYRVGATEF